MYAFLKGKIENVLEDKIELDVNGMGYEIFMPENEISQLEKSDKVIKINTYLHVREDDVRLFGFLSSNTLEFFKKLISVSGVGPKVAIGIISNISASDMCIAIATENVAEIKKVPGIGPKMAQKIIFELKDKIMKDEISNIKNNVKVANKKNTNVSEAITALQVLGYSEKEINEVISNIEIENDKVEDIIKKVLKQMQK